MLYVISVTRSLPITFQHRNEKPSSSILYIIWVQYSSKSIFYSKIFTMRRFLERSFYVIYFTSRDRHYPQSLKNSLFSVTVALPSAAVNRKTQDDNVRLYTPASYSIQQETPISISYLFSALARKLVIDDYYFWQSFNAFSGNKRPRARNARKHPFPLIALDLPQSRLEE